MSPVTPDKSFWKIMVVDDEKVVTRVLKTMLEEDGYTQITIMFSGEQAIEKLNEGAYHLVLVDKNLPGIDGLEVIRQGKEIRPACQFIVITGFASLSSAVASMELGACYYLTKPFHDSGHICQLVKSALDNVAYTIHLDALAFRMSNSVKKLTGLMAEDHPGRGEIEQLSVLVRQLHDLAKRKSDQRG